jgi:hypothetical protein
LVRTEPAAKKHPVGTTKTTITGALYDWLTICCEKKSHRGSHSHKAAGAWRTLAIGWPQGFALGSAMKTFTATAVIIALLTVPAFSQQGKGSAPDPKAEAEKVEQKKRAQEIERDYKALIKRTTPQSTSVPSDPWHDIRPSPSKPQQ